MCDSCSGTAQCVPDSTCPNFNIVRFQPWVNNTGVDTVTIPQNNTPFDVRITGNMDRDPITVALECDYDGSTSDWDYTNLDFDTNRDANITFKTDGSTHNNGNPNITALCDYTQAKTYQTRIRIDRWTGGNKSGSRIRKIASTSVDAQRPVCPTPQNQDAEQLSCSLPSETTGEIRWSWDPVPGANEYNFRVWPDSKTTSANWNDSGFVLDTGYLPESVFDCGSGRCSIDYPSEALPYFGSLPADSLTAGDLRSAMVRARNIATCSGSDPKAVLGDVTIIDCGLNTYSVGGRVYTANTATISGNRCNPTGQQQLSAISGTWTIEANGQSSTVASDGTYTPLNLLEGSSYIASLNFNGDTEYGYLCPGDGDLPTGNVTGPINDLNFYVTQTRGDWFQTEGGNVHINNSNLQDTDLAFSSQLPTSCLTPDCNPFVFLNHPTYPLSSTTGILTLASGIFDTLETPGEQQNSLTLGGTPVFVASRAPSTTFERFLYLYQFPETPVDDFSGQNVITEADFSDVPLNPGISAYFADATEDPKGLGNNISLQAGQSVVLFVDGNLNIPFDVTVDSGGFFAVIVSGNITIGQNVGNNDIDDDTANIQGFYFAGGNITIEDSPPDRRIVLEGSFIANQGFNLLRDLDDDNDLYPGELFRFRPDFLVNLPPEFKLAPFRWSEVAP